MPCRQEYGIIGYTLLMSLIEYKTLVMREDYEGANSMLPTIPQVCATQRSQHIEMLASWRHISMGIEALSL